MNDRDLCKAEPTPRSIELAVFVMLRASSAASRKALKDGRLRGLGAVSQGGVVWVSGRICGEKLAELLGTRESARPNGN